MINQIKMITIFSLLTLISISAYGTGHRGLENEIIYYIVVDRFFDGNKENNIPNWAFPFPEKISKQKLNNLRQNGSLDKFKKNYLKKQKKSEWNRAYLEKMYDKSGKKFQHYQGGDLEGIIKKLDYLFDLGITTIMISPIFENINGIFYGGGNTAYHGYWTKDWFRLEEHFVNPPLINESLEQTLKGERILKRLVKGARKRGIKIILDLSLNHTSPITEDGNVEAPTIYRDGVLVNKYCHKTSKTTCEETINKSGFYNPRKAITNWNDDFELQTYQMHSLVDINQRDKQAKKYLIDAAAHWLKFGIAGYRIDAIKHIFPEFIKELEEKLLEKKNDIILIGEYFDGGDHNKKSIDWVESTERYTIFDFSLAIFMREFFTNITDYDKRNTPAFLKKILEEGSKVSKDFVTFINNHDLPRMLTLENSSIDQYLSALKFMMISRGIPKLTYGDEIAYALKYEDIPTENINGNLIASGADPWCRNLMDFSWLNSDDNIHLRKNSIFNMTKELIKLRKRRAVLRYGDTKLLFPESRSIKQRIGFDELSILRSSNLFSSKVYFFYSRVAQTLKYKVKIPDGQYSDLINKNRIFTIKNGIISLKMNENDSVILEIDNRENEK